MNENQSSPEVPPMFSRPAPAEKSPRYWFHRLLACNPLYLVSAACLLYGLYQLTIDPTLRNAELGQLASIFGSLQVYEVLLVVTAIFLARRRIWYDSTLLVTLENMLVFVPFILVTVAAFMGNSPVWMPHLLGSRTPQSPLVESILGNLTAWVVCVTGAGMAILKFWGLKRQIRELNLPSRLLLIGVALLVVNLFVPFIFKATLKVDAGPLAGYSRIGWLVMLPVLFAMVNLLRPPEHWGGVAAQRSWLPLLFAAIWFAVSAVHLYCLGYIYDLYWQPALLAPLLWVASWTLYNRFADCADILPREWRPQVLVLPMVAMLLGAWEGTPQIVLALATLNAALYGTLYYNQRDKRVAGHLLLISLTAMIAAMPESWGRAFSVNFDRSEWVLCAVGGYIIGQSIFSRHPVFGVIGVLAVMIAGARMKLDGHPIIQAGLIFMLLHSLRWQASQHSGADGLRVIVAVGWVWHSAFWVFGGEPRNWLTLIAAAVLLFGFLGVWFFSRRWISSVVPIAAGLVMLMLPTKWLVIHATAGLVAVLLAFVLFGGGTFIALMREKWNPLQKPS